MRTRMLVLVLSVIVAWLDHAVSASGNWKPF